MADGLFGGRDRSREPLRGELHAHDAGRGRCLSRPPRGQPDYGHGRRHHRSLVARRVGRRHARHPEYGHRNTDASEDLLRGHETRNRGKRIAGLRRRPGAQVRHRRHPYRGQSAADRHQRSHESQENDRKALRHGELPAGRGQARSARYLRIQRHQVPYFQFGARFGQRDPVEQPSAGRNRPVADRAGRRVGRRVQLYDQIRRRGRRIQPLGQGGEGPHRDGTPGHRRRHGPAGLENRRRTGP